MAKFTIEQVLENIKAKLGNEFNEKNPLLVTDRTMTENLTPFLSLVGDDMELDAFVDTYCLPGVRSAQGNMMKNRSDDWKKFNDENQQKTPPVTPPTPPALKNGQLDVDALVQRLAETQTAAMNKAIEPLQARLAEFESERAHKSLMETVNQKRDALKLSRNWQVDFDNSVELAIATLPKEATADQVYDTAYEHFNKTLTSRGETYKPQEGTGGGTTTSFDGLKAQLEKRKKQNV